MKIETYEIEEINNSEASTMAADGEATELIEKLRFEVGRLGQELDEGIELTLTTGDEPSFSVYC